MNKKLEVDLKLFNGYIFEKMNNQVYGTKLGFLKKNLKTESIEFKGIIELIPQEFSSRKSRSVINLVIPISLKYLMDSKFASEFWVKDICSNLSKLDEKLGANSSKEGPGKIGRFWGIIADTGSIDDFAINQIMDSISALKLKLERYQSGYQINNTRTLMTEIISDIWQLFGYTEWYPGYRQAFEKVSNQLLSVLGEIELAEIKRKEVILKGRYMIIIF